MTRRRQDRREGDSSWYRIVNATDGPAQVMIYEEIGFFGISAQDFIHDMSGISGPVEVHINSPGGDVFDAYAIYNSLVSRPGVTTVVDSLAASAASVIAMAGEQRLMARTSQMMIHDAWAFSDGNAGDLRHMADRLDTVSGQIAGIYADTAGGTEDHWRELMRVETWFTPQQAMDAGLITGVVGTGREPATAGAGAGATAEAGAIIAAAGAGATEVTPVATPAAPAAGPAPNPATPAAPADNVPADPGSNSGQGPASQSRVQITDAIERTTAMPQNEDALTIEARRGRIGEIAERCSEIAAQYPASMLPTDVQAEWDRLVAERRDHQAALDAVDARAAQLAEMHLRNTAGHDASIDRGQNPAAPAGAPPAGQQNGLRAAGPANPAFHPSRNIYDLAEIRQQARSSEDLPVLYKENARRAIDVARFPGSKREQAQETVSGLLDTIEDDKDGALARRILATGSPDYKRAFGRALAVGNPGALGAQEARVLALGESDTGSYAVPFELDPTVLLTSDGTVNPLRQISRVVQITGKEYDLVTSAGVTVSRKAEFAAETDNAPTLAQPTIKAEKVSGFIPFSVELEGDWTGLQASMMELLRDAKDVEEATAFTLGTGVAPDASGVVSTLAGGSNVTGTGGVATLGIDDAQALENALPPRFRQMASYLAAKTTYNAYRSLFGDQAGYATDPWNRPSLGQPRELWGYAAYEASDMDATHATGDKVLLMGDFKRGFIIVDKVGMNMELVPHLFGAAQGQYPTGRRGYYAWWRNNSRVLIDNAFRLLVVG